MNYNDYNINNITYEKALKIDKRTYCQYYLSLIKNNHILLFTFRTNKDHNPREIKICFFFFILSLYMFFNTLFFNDFIMHQIYMDKGKFNFIIVLPQMIYSVIICNIIIIIIKQLSLSQSNILKMKTDYINIINVKIFLVIKCIKMKLFFFFLLDFIFLLFFWYFLSCFCFIYSNTQIYLFTVILISYSISLLFPFIFSLIPALFRISALKSPGQCFYKTSKLFHLV